MSCKTSLKCSIAQLPTKLMELVKQRISPEEEILTCYLCEMQEEGLIWGIGGKRYYIAAVITNQAVLRAVESTSYIVHLNLVDVITIRTLSDEIYKHYVHVQGHGTTGMRIPLISQEYTSEFSSILQQAVNKAKAPKLQTGSKNDNVINRLKQLQQLLSEGLIDQREYDQKRKEILNDL